MSASAYTGLPVVARLTWRLDRLRILAWGLGMAALVAAVNGTWDAVYPTALARVQFAASMQATPALTSILGPLFNPVATGGLTAWRISSGVIVALGIVNVFLVVRHTRAEEVTGRADLVLSGRIGRVAPSLGALGSAAAVAVLFAIASVVALVAARQDVAGSLAFALGVAGASLVFAAVGLLVAQGFATPRAANATGTALVALVFVLYAVGNSSSEALAMATPFGWASRSRPFAGEQWWLVAMPWLSAVVIAAVAVLIGRRRDVGSAVVSARRGRSSAGRSVGSAAGIAWRVDRGQVLTWLVSLFIMGAFVGYLSVATSDLLAGNPQLSEFLDRFGGVSGAKDSYILVMVGVVSLATAAYGVASLLRVRADEESGRMELLLSTPTSRSTYLTSRAVIVGVGIMLIQIALGVGAGLGGGPGGGALGRDVGIALLNVPAILVCAGFTLAVVGALPRFSWLAWALYAYCVILGELGSILGLPTWTQRTTPFWFTPKWPAEPLSVTPLVAMTLVAAVLAAAGLVAFRRRDVPA